MIKKILLLAAIVLVGNSLLAQEHFIKYGNTTEQKLISTAGTPADYIKLALVADLEATQADAVIAKLADETKKLGWEGTSNQKADKRLKNLFASIHKSFLKRYDENASFNKLFETGEYQCVGASILYAYFLEQFQVPYQIKETPTHVYVVAYPDSYNILLETTDPTKGYYVPDDKAKAQYIKALIKSKYVDEAYVTKVGIDQAFNEFFYSKTSITLKDAVGLLYYNKAIEKLEDDKLADAYSNIAKAQLLYPVKKTEFLKHEVLGQMINNFKFNDLSDWEGLAYLVNANDVTEETKNYLEYKFSNLLDTKLWKEGKRDKVSEVYNYLTKELADSTVRSNIVGNYLYENARYSYMANNLPEALEYLDKAIAKNSGNPLLNTMVVSIMNRRLSGQNASVANLSTLEQNVAKYPFMAKDPLIRSIFLYNYSFLSYSAFQREDKDAAEKYFNLMINEMETFKDHERRDETQLASVFGIASEYYFRKAGAKKSVEILAEGLKYFPNDETLQRKYNTNKSALKK